LLRWRIVLGAVLIAAIVGLFWLDATTTPGAWLFFVVLVVAMGGAQEVVTLLGRAGLHPLAAVIYGGTLAVVASNAIPLFYRPMPEERALERLAWPLLAFTATLLAAFVGEMRRYRQPGGVTVNVALATFGVAYVGLLFSFALQLRILGGPTAGLLATITTCAVVKLGDIGAYTVGRLIGRHKMAPSISPGKTLEGAAGGLAFACLGAWLSLVAIPTSLGVSAEVVRPNWVVFGLLVGATGMIGDLAESLLKRDLGSKDSSAWMPGFGGVLDLLDSILVAAPVAYFICWATGT
jgi:phosphatidate cytidylyltransferase